LNAGGLVKKVSGDSYKLNVHESTLAAYSGLARETVSRELKHLKDKKLIEVHHTYILLNDLKKLEQLVGQAA